MTPSPATSRRGCHRPSWRVRRRHDTYRPCTSPRALPASSHMALETAIEHLATIAAYDLRRCDGGAPEPPMLWHYQVVDAHLLSPASARWPDRGAAGQNYMPVVLEVSNERLNQPYLDEQSFNCLPKSMRSLLGPLPLLVRVQYMNSCHVLNGAAAMALVRHAAMRRERWTIAGLPVRAIGWRWGNAPDGLSLTLAQVGTERVKHQAHAHQLVAIVTEAGTQYLLDLSVAQFGSTAAVRCTSGLVPAAAGQLLSSTLRERAADGIAPALFARADSETAALVSHCRLERSQDAVEAALGLLDGRTSTADEHGTRRTADGAQDGALCEHVMPRPYFRAGEPAGPQPDDALVETELLSRLSQFGRALMRCSETNGVLLPCPVSALDTLLGPASLGMMTTHRGKVLTD